MEYLFKPILIFLALLINFGLYGQDVPIGTWKDYLSFRNGITVTMGQNSSGQNIIYCVAGSALFSYNTSDNSIDKLTKISGLSDVGPSVARYNTNDHVLVIGYPDGNIDILNNKTITNIPDLVIDNLQGSKNINCIYYKGDSAYIGCGQGILQVDLTQNVIRNAYYIGNSGTALNVRGITICNDTIFAATDNGVYLASLNSNLNYYAYWHKATNPILNPGVYSTITTVGDSVYVNHSALYTRSVGDQDTVFVYYNGHWSLYNNLLGSNLTTVNSLESSVVNNKNLLVASLHYGLTVYDAAGNVFRHAGSYFGLSGGASPNDAIMDIVGNSWVADNNLGLVKASGIYSAGTIYTPSGPNNNQVFTLAVNNNNLWVVPGGYDASYNPVFNQTGISSLQGSTWSYIPQAPGESDLNCIAIDPWKPLHYFLGSWGGGLLEYNSNKLVNKWTALNSAIQNINVANDTNYRTGGIVYDTIGNLWVTNSLAASKYLTVEKPDLAWKAFDFSLFVQPSATVTSVLITQSQAKWMLFNGTGILAYQDFGSYADPNSSNTHLINNQTGNGGLPSLNIFCMAVDQNGSIWVGTDAQVVVFYSPDNVFDGNHDWDAQPVYVTQNGYTQYLMQNQVTTAIAVDGANRKWIGTQSGGVFLMSADGTQQIYNFTKSNSPLLSNNIQTIAINQNNGEVFFGTDKGIISFRSTATEGLTSFGKVYAFPDPVPHDYSGPIAIKNLVSNADVKITTVNGELVYHTTALGGQAIWNGNNFDGRRVQTGVYLIFCASPDGSQTLVSKLLFIN